MQHPDARGYNAVTDFLFPAGHTERAMLYHELKDGMYSVTSYFFAKVNPRDLQQGSVPLRAGDPLQGLVQSQECGKRGNTAARI